MLLIFAIFFIANFLVAAPQDVEQLKRDMLTIKKEVHGWCSDEKSQGMVDLILETEPLICVEIGVFGGSSILPTAMALKFLKKGVVYAIDPWETSEALKGLSPVHAKWWSNVDLEMIYQGYLGLIQKQNLEDYVITLRSTSAKISQAIPDIDILHIDGNHSREVVLTDIELYFPKVKKGGYIWFDDVMDFGSPEKPTLIALNQILPSCIILKYVDNGNCVLLKKN